MTNLETLRRKIIEAIHQKPYEEAVRLELGFGCILKRKKGAKNLYDEDIKAIVLDKCLGINVCEVIWINGEDGITYEKINGEKCSGGDLERAKAVNEGIKIIGLPITLSRFLLSLRNQEIDFKIYDFSIEPWSIRIEVEEANRITIDWQFADDNGKELTLDKQSEETWSKLLELFN